ncbi:MAG: NADPH-dependent glutamate synthase [Bacteroidales bacterium]|jgi:glutamate synthase (NADPH/NADH) small chain|nr:NADPH-dependent glutamate synthase [Bacteroidales bacterium]
MYKIVKKQQLAEETVLMNIEAPRIAKSAHPGQFVIIIGIDKGERIPLTICDYDSEAGTITLVIKAIGSSTKKIVQLQEGEFIKDVVGPLGHAAEWIHEPIAELKKKKLLFIGGGVGIAPIFPQVKWMYQNGIEVDVIIGARNRELLILKEELRTMSKNLYTTIDNEGLVTDVFRKLVEEGHQYDRVIAIGPLIMMKFTVDLAKEFGIPSTVSLNSLMLDGTGMCGACRVSIGGKTKFTCVDGPEFDGEQVNFKEALRRQAQSATPHGRIHIEKEEKAENHECFIGGVADEVLDRKKRVPVRNQPATVRKHNFEEVCYGYNREEAVLESQRCLQCKKAHCRSGCPVNIDIPKFIGEVAVGNFEEAYKIIDQDSALPAICGRVCPQETQCECLCILGKKGDAVSIGKLERFIGDYAIENQLSNTKKAPSNGHKIAIVGSGPAGITCAKELLIKGFNVTIFEALHEYGGVLAYGIPSFRLPKEEVVNVEIENVRKLGAKFENNVIIGKTVTIDDLFEKEHFEAIFIGSGAGLPSFMNIPGENLNGVVSANEFLTRNNLLFAYKEDYDTPSHVGKKTIVVGGGNVAMDAARTAVRLGSDVSVVYRRSEAELPARIEEVEHAKEEGITFYMLTNPTEILGNEQGYVSGMRCIRMALGEPDSSGRRRPVPVERSEFIIETDFVVMSIGTSPNPLISRTTPDLETNKWGCIVADEVTGQTSRSKIFAGGDAVSGAATVILAMGAGKAAARAIEEDFAKN